ncbi:helix-turn-helix transcriptional regulator [Ruegeria meonggei]|uniref:helix-turn-helix transcriptional regulator n=1 Tax=Ruegeria meonggei TaxID=1446476 RepID=UPI00366C9B16
MHDKYYTYQEVMDILRASRSTIKRRVADGTLPAPILFGKTPRFKESEVTEALARLDEVRAE